MNMIVKLIWRKYPWIVLPKEWDDIIKVLRE